MHRLAAIFLVVFSSCYFSIQAQDLLKWEDFEMMTQKVIAIPYLTKSLLTDVYKNKPSVFIESYPTLSGEHHSVSQEKADPPYFIWTKEELFFHAIDLYIVPTEIVLNDNTAVYNFVLGSVTGAPRTQISGTISLIKEKGRWQISESTIKK